MSGIITNEKAMEERHHRIMEAEAKKPDETSFRIACKMFVNACNKIRTFIGNNSFKGGFEDYGMFIMSSASQQNPSQAALLAAEWSGCNTYCVYEAGKIGLASPEWWYKCWELNDAGELNNVEIPLIQ